MVNVSLNRKGSLPFIFLVFIAAGLVITAWVTFLTFDSRLGESGEQIRDLTDNTRVGDIYISKVFEDSVNNSLSAIRGSANFQQDFTKKFEEIIAARDVKLSFGKTFFEKISKHEYSITFDPLTETFSLSVSEIMINTNRKGSEITRPLYLEIKFNETDILS